MAAVVAESRPPDSSTIARFALVGSIVTSLNAVLERWAVNASHRVPTKRVPGRITNPSYGHGDGPPRFRRTDFQSVRVRRVNRRCGGATGPILTVWPAPIQPGVHHATMA